MPLESSILVGYLLFVFLVFSSYVSLSPWFPWPSSIWFYCWPCDKDSVCCLMYDIDFNQQGDDEVSGDFM
jgi:hypothetical protein